MNSPREKLRALGAELTDLDHVVNLLSWDEETYLPERGRAGRGRQAGTVEALRHQRLVGPELGAALEGAMLDPALTADERATIERLARRRRLASRIPESLVRRIAETRSKAVQAWIEARREARFSLFAGPLGELLGLIRERADALTESGQPYDALLDEFEPEMSAARLGALFAPLEVGLKTLLDALRGAPDVPSAARFAQPYGVEAQGRLCREVIELLGFDLDRGRLDLSVHPFSSAHGQDDVRLTTRFSAEDPLDALYSSIHEAGHGMYEQGWSAEHAGTPLASAPSYGLHESQSRLWENQVGRSRAFWVTVLPRMRTLFPAQMEGATVDELYRAVNVVAPGFIRVDADEVTYNLHIILRFELERALFSGDLPVAELPGAWRAGMKRLLGLEPPDDRVGCLQDIHWASAAFGYFPSYTVGNVYAAMLMEAFAAAHPDHGAEFEAGRFGGLLGWLRREVHAKGYLYSAEETVRRVTGRPLSVEPLLASLGAKYRAVYGL